MKLLVLERFKHMKLGSLPCCVGRLSAVVGREYLRGCRGQVVGGAGLYMGGGGQTARGRRTVTVQTESRRTVSTEAARCRWKAQLLSDRESPTVTSRSVAIFLVWMRSW